jgi:superfamily II DNA helicase RecQ
MKYRAIVVNPEELMKLDGPFERLLRKPAFISKLLGIIIDEAHCISEWGDFRKEYRALGRLRYILPRNVRFMLASATLPPLILKDCFDVLRIQQDCLTLFHRSNDRPNVHLVVREIQSTIASFHDLSFLLDTIPLNWQPGDLSPPTFLCFFDDINESIAACKWLRKQVPIVI